MTGVGTMEIADLDLAEPALGAAILLKQVHPNISFTSGRRAVKDQARAMASNVVHNREWIRETYTNTAESASLQAWVDAHPQATTRDAIQAGLQAVMRDWTNAQKGKLSKHFSGLAFDVEPVPDGEAATAIKHSITRLPGLVKFLEKEGGLTRWHAQFA